MYSLKSLGGYNLSGRQGKVIWFTGLSGSGKSTLCLSTAELLVGQMRPVEILDADRVREELNSDLGFSLEDRLFAYDEVHGLRVGAGPDRLLCSVLRVGCWGELVEALDGAVGESWQGGGEIFADRDAEPAAAFDDGEDRRDLWARFLASQMDPIFSSDRHRSHRVFGEVGA